MGLLPDMQNCGLRMRWECRERFRCHRFQMKPIVSDPSMHNGMMHVGFATPRWRGKRYRLMRRPQFCVSGKRPIGQVLWLVALVVFRAIIWPSTLVRKLIWWIEAFLHYYTLIDIIYIYIYLYDICIYLSNSIWIPCTSIFPRGVLYSSEWATIRRHTYIYLYLYIPMYVSAIRSCTWNKQAQLHQTQ